ncbi:hypothetical protein [Streptomyces sp. SID3343]|uniref:hypothetical protein n=1 Tax=Streptomyces sp. SID3343 TaxID=2690260 RepID=UPI00136DC92D|nr:hypothetical protein [Streptomyces sp. SID3343]MYW06050.1 hypothetical protein [Streptomyces sp. SID3343]
MAEHVLVTHIGGERVELPGTIGGIRAGLPDDDTRDEFDRAIAQAPLEHVALIAAQWGLPKAARDEDDALIARIRAGDPTAARELTPEELDYESADPSR